MRRGFSILLVLLFGLGPLSAIAGGEDANLPACCRRHGAHHCAMTMHMVAIVREADPQTHLSSQLTCPNYPGLSAVFTAPAAALIAPAIILPSRRTRAFAPVAVQTIPPSSPSRNHAGRGPPAAILS
jgi:hypothetical protein